MNKQKANEIDIDQLIESPGSVSIITKENKKTIYIIGEINECVANDTITAILEADWKNTKELHLYITSQGGDLADCFAIIDMLLELKQKHQVVIYTYGLGEIASAGFFIFIAGDIRFIYPSCRVFVHTHITIDGVRTFTERIKSDRTEEKEVYENYASYTAAQLDLSLVKAKNLLKKNKWLTKKEIKDYNIFKVGT